MWLNNEYIFVKYKHGAIYYYVEKDLYDKASPKSIV